MKNNFLYLVSGIFGLIFVLHGLRVIFEWEVVFNGWLVPMWFSWVSLAASGFLSYRSFRIAKKFA